jgi:hypothetical protein
MTTLTLLEGARHAKPEDVVSWSTAKFLFAESLKFDLDHLSKTFPAVSCQKQKLHIVASWIFCSLCKLSTAVLEVIYNNLVFYLDDDSLISTEPIEVSKIDKKILHGKIKLTNSSCTDEFVLIKLPVYRISW